jgi:hypothetical protein
VLLEEHDFGRFICLEEPGDDVLVSWGLAHSCEGINFGANVLMEVADVMLVSLEIVTDMSMRP